VNFAFVVVVLAAVTGLASELALRTIAPQAGPALAMAVMAIALISTAAWRSGSASSRARAVEEKPRRVKSLVGTAGESLAPT
jgi:hypothetical protein